MNLQRIYKIYSWLFFSLLLTACSKDINEQNLNYPKLNPQKADTNAGVWKPILINSPTEIVCPNPYLISIADFSSQASDIKRRQEAMTEEEQAQINYWRSGAVLRWNEIMRELVAKNNIAPAQNSDTTYYVPSTISPFAYPNFPFSNPPYAARAYAYLSAAQYDGIVTAYHYKSKFKSPFPHQVDGSIIPYFSNSSQSSYPSEDAVIMAASVEILKLMFPADIDFIERKANEHMNARLNGGGNFRMDIEAGTIIGKAVAEKYITRAKSDKTNLAIGNAQQWESMKQSTITNGEIPWLSQESPSRPPMLPLFGNVTPFLFSSATISTSLRPIPPPSTHSAQFKSELEEVYQIVLNLNRDQERIANFWADGVKTYTPPGHWNYIAANDFVTQQFSEPRWARNLALLNMSMMDAAIVCWDAKYYYFNPRPMQIDSRIKTIVGLPNFPSYISGHSTFSGAAETILSYILPIHSARYNAMAKEASESRLYGGIHYRSDCEIGILTGNKVGNYAVERGKIDGAN